MRCRPKRLWMRNASETRSANSTNEKSYKCPSVNSMPCSPSAGYNALQENAKNYNQAPAAAFTRRDTVFSSSRQASSADFPASIASALLFNQLR